MADKSHLSPFAIHHSGFVILDSTRPNLRAIEKRRWRSDPGVAAS